MARVALLLRRRIIGSALHTALAGAAAGAILAGFAHHVRVPSMATSSKAKKKTVRLASGRKRARQDVKLNAANSSLRSKFRTAIKNVQKAVLTGDKAKATELYKSAQSVIDSIADKGLFHKNKAARHKSRLSAKLKALAA
jgi:small subunit ribosomal protein S20